MQSADAVTPDPTYGTAASSSRPCTVPSSPNGPWRIGRTTSTGPSGVGALVRGTGSVAGRRRLRQRPRRAESAPTRGRQLPAAVAADADRRHLVALGSSAAATDAAEASEISCSLDRPPASTATRRDRSRGRRRRSGLVVVGGVVTWAAGRTA